MSVTRGRVVVVLSAVVLALQFVSMSSASATGDSTPSGERVHGMAAVEPAYNADTGKFMYLLTPIKAPLPSHANVHARSPLYIVVYPSGSTVGTRLNCEGDPGNCPDHDDEIVQAAMGVMPSVYGNGVLGHDHVADPPGAPDWNVAWEVYVVLFTNSTAANTHLTTDAAIHKAIKDGDAIKFDAGFAFNCSSVSAASYWRGSPVAVS